MNLQFYVEKLQSSKNFQDFIKENPDAFLCSAFFIIDKEGNDNKQHFDYFSSKTEKIFSFQLENAMQLVPLQALDKKIPEKILLNYDFDFKDIEKMIIDEMGKQRITNKIQKLIFSLQNLKGKDFLVGTIFISMLGLLKINIDISEKKITDFSKKSFMDMLKVIRKKKKNF